MKIKNKTPYKSLDEISRHPDVEEIWDEGDDGIWLSLKYPYAAPCTQRGVIHEYSLRHLVEGFRQYLKTPMRYTKDGTGCVQDESRTPVQKWK